MNRVAAKISRSLSGSIAEKFAEIYLLTRGYEVHSPSTVNSKADLVAIDSDGNVRLFDVKKAGTDINRGGGVVINEIVSSPDAFKRMGVEFLYVWYDIESLKFIVHDCPFSFYDEIERMGMKTCRAGRHINKTKSSEKMQ